MPGRTRKQIEPRRVAHKSTDGMLHSIPKPVDPVGNAPYLTFNTVASPITSSWHFSAVARSDKFLIAFLFATLFALSSCGDFRDMLPRDTASLLVPKFRRSEVFGFIAGLGTTFAAVPDLIAMLKSHSSVGMNPRMAAIMGVFQILWVYYGLLILSRPVIFWNVIAVLTNFLNVAAYLHFARMEQRHPTLGSER